MGEEFAACDLLVALGSGTPRERDERRAGSKAG
jgi:hypothetical protein